MAADAENLRGASAGPSILHLVLPGGRVVRPSLTLRPRRWSQGFRRDVRGCDAAVWACRECIAASPELEHRVCVVGGNEAGERSAAMGLETHARLAPPFSRPELALTGYRNLLREWGTPQVVMCWGGDFAALRDRVVAGGPEAGAGREMRGPVWMVADLHAGVLEVRDSEHTREPLTQALTPWLPVPHALTQRDREAVREAFNVGPGELLCALIGDPPAACDAITLAYMAGILHVGGVRVVPVVPRGAYQLERALRHVGAGGYLGDLRLIDGPMSLIAPGCDLGVCIPVAPTEHEMAEEPALPSKLAVARAAAMGLPIVMSATPWAQGLLPEGAQVCLSPSNDHAALAKRVFALAEDGQRRLRYARAALIEHSVNAPPRGLVEEVLAAWSRACSGPLAPRTSAVTA
ncbi:MAG TPA: hypothetical protein VD997_04840 [Phycisphaerales bacterium]|nr:hypothetical protein [Phycisphaerales bacterium]